MSHAPALRDLVCWQGHLYLDAAIADATGKDGVHGGPGAAAAKRADAKVRKYKPICDRLGAVFKAAVMERHGHCDDGMVSYIKLLSGDGERSLMDEDQTFSAPSRTTYVAQRIVFAAVHADAELVGRFIGCAAYGIPMDTRQRGLMNFHH